MHPWALIVADEDATAGENLDLNNFRQFTDPPMYHLCHACLNPSELRVKTVKYFKSIERVQDEVEATHRALAKCKQGISSQVGQMD